MWNRPSPIRRRSSCLGAFLAIGLCAAVTAQSANRVEAERLSEPVSLSGLDLTTPEGTRIARDRIRQQALRLCRKFSDSRKISDRQTVADCTRQATEDAMTKIISQRGHPS